MSNTLRYDPLLVHYLAAELDARLRGRLCAGGLTFTGERSAVLPLSDRQALSLDLHPTRGWIRVVPWDGDEALEGECLGVSASPDERLLRISLDLPDRFRGGTRALVVELHTNQWNVLLLDEAERIISLAWSRNAGGRALRSGMQYAPPPPSHRVGAAGTNEAEAWSEWRRTVGAADGAGRRQALLRGFAYTGAVNADFILSTSSAAPAVGDPESESAEREAFQRWWWLRSLPAARPVLLVAGTRRTPYPFPLGDTPREPVGSLLEGMDLLAALPHESAPTRALPPLEARGRARRAAIARRVERLREELAGAEGADEVRASADLLLAKLHEVPRGADEARLLDWEGAEVAIALDPALSPADNAARLYDEARRRVRGAQRVEGLLEEATADLERWDLALEGEALPDWAVKQLEDAHGATVSTEVEEPIRPYRTYRTSGGLEVRVGKTARGNDELTFKHSSPNDVWLHAQSVPGSHVVLRWPDAVSAPPARDLEEAAMLAALFSRARTSSLVSVVWTRRKHVRKPRGAAPGSVIPQKVKTVLVEPDPSVAERLRIG